MKILIGSDKMGESLKNHLKSYLICKGYKVIDKTEDGMDLVDSAHVVCK